MRNLRIPAIVAFLAALSVPSFGQGRTQWRTAGDIEEGVRGTVVGTVVDVNEGNSQLQLSADDDRYNNIRVLTDSVSTTYSGFGGVINGSPEVFTGTSGFSNVRMNDRVEIRGTGRGTGVVLADQITLLGRPVAAPQTGVGQTRMPNSISTPMPPASTAAPALTGVEGTVRDVDAAGGMVVVETDRRELFRVRTASTTPVYYNGDVYQVRNLEVGDQVRVETDGAAASAGSEVRARSIDVVRGVQEGRSNLRVSSLAGRVAQVDRATNSVRIDTGLGQPVRVDLSQASDSTGRPLQATDFRVGDRVEITGTTGANASQFVASTVRFTQAPPVAAPAPVTPPSAQPDFTDYATVTLSGTVTDTLQNSATLGVRDRATGRVVDVFITDDFAVRTKTGGYQSADKLAVGDNILLKAFRDPNGILIAQTIRMR